MEQYAEGDDIIEKRAREENKGEGERLEQWQVASHLRSPIRLLWRLIYIGIPERLNPNKKTLIHEAISKSLNNPKQ